MAPKGPWSSSEVLEVAAAESREPAVAMLGETLHLVWNCNRQLYHAWRTSEGWSRATTVAIGEQPALAAAPDGQLHCLFVNQFARNFEIYHVWWDGIRWSLPVNVSRTLGASSLPVLAVGSDGSLHAAWADTTPGYSVIYYGTRGSFFWSARPVPSGRGAAPTITSTPDGAIFIAWQDRRSDTDNYDIFCSTYRDDTWQPPESVSDSASTNSLLPKLAASKQGEVHLIWQEEREGLYHIFHSDHRSNGWSQPIDVSQTTADCRLAQIANNPLGYIHVAWSDGQTISLDVRPTLPDAPWRNPETASEDCYEIDALVMAVSNARTSYIIWCALDQSDTRQLFYAQREPFPRHVVFLPIVAG
jgi:hypothetical protein